jgi:osmotically-inducible protein OsmY
MESDKQITENVFQALLWDARVSPARIDVDTKNGHVTLSGTVDNFHKKWSAIDNAMKVANVVHVVDHIKVEPTDVVTDAALQQNIEKALLNDSRLAQTHIGCSVENGSISLQGSVHTFYQRVAAEESCRWVKGVVNVINEIEVVPRDSDYDEQIHRRIKDLIDQNIKTNTTNINIQVENGIVLLTGHVKSYINKIYAETLASMVSNVSYIQNELIVEVGEDTN